MAECTKCKNPDAYVGFGVTECPNPQCENFSKRQYEEVSAAKGEDNKVVSVRYLVHTDPEINIVANMFGVGKAVIPDPKEKSGFRSRLCAKYGIPLDAWTDFLAMISLISGEDKKVLLMGDSKQVKGSVLLLASIWALGPKDVAMLVDFNTSQLSWTTDRKSLNVIIRTQKGEILDANKLFEVKLTRFGRKVNNTYKVSVEPKNERAQKAIAKARDWLILQELKEG